MGQLKLKQGAVSLFGACCAAEGVPNRPPKATDPSQYARLLCRIAWSPPTWIIRIANTSSLFGKLLYHYGSVYASDGSVYALVKATLTRVARSPREDQGRAASLKGHDPLREGVALGGVRHDRERTVAVGGARGEFAAFARGRSWPTAEAFENTTEFRLLGNTGRTILTFSISQSDTNR